MRHLYCAVKYCAYSIAMVLLFLNASCVNTRKTTYFNSIGDTILHSSTIIPDSKIQPNDLLSISVSSLNPEASALFNAPNTSTLSSDPDPASSGYLVSKEGDIQFPLIGSIKAAGLTKDELIGSITNSLVNRKLLIDPIVAIRFMNFRVTVLGEVENPTVVNVPSEKITLLEALGFAGDMTIYAKRNNVLLIREENNAKQIKRLNLNSGELFTSPYYYLKSNDIVYVEPGKAKVATASRSMQWLPVLLSALSVVTIVVDRLTR